MLRLFCYNVSVSRLLFAFLNSMHNWNFNQRNVIPNTRGHSFPKFGESYVPNVIVGMTKKVIEGSHLKIIFIFMLYLFNYTC